MKKAQTDQIFRLWAALLLEPSKEDRLPIQSQLDELLISDLESVERRADGAPRHEPVKAVNDFSGSARSLTLIAAFVIASLS